MTAPTTVPTVVSARCELSGCGDAQASARSRVASTQRDSGEIPDHYELAREWADVRDRKALQEHRAAELFHRQIVTAPTLASAVGMTAYRGRSLVAPTKPVDDFGPPPRIECRRAGRYNEEGEAVLYLCERADGVIREVEVERPGERVWMRQFTVPAALKLADLRVGSVVEGNFVNDVLHFAELAPRSGSEFSRVVGGIVAGTFDGMIVPGVPGTEDLRYANIVIFRADGREWRDWLDQEFEPIALGLA